MNECRAGQTTYINLKLLMEKLTPVENALTVENFITPPANSLDQSQ